MTTVIAVACWKGGVGKTTTAVMLAEMLDGNVLLIDLDPQTDSSSTGWHSEADEVGVNMTASPMGIPGARDLEGHVSRSDHDWVVIDAPGAPPKVTQAAIDVADIVLIPATTNVIDLRRAITTAAAATAAGKPHAVLLNKTRARTRSRTEARDGLMDAGLTLLDAEIPDREAIKQSYGTNGAKLADLYRPVAAELAKLR